LYGGDLPEVDVALGLVEQFTAYGRRVADELLNRARPGTRSASSRNRVISARTLFSMAPSRPSSDATSDLHEPDERTNHAHLSRHEREFMPTHPN
jgi:hypothetical protein